jgi:hypothetical protein
MRTFRIQHYTARTPGQLVEMAKTPEAELAAFERRIYPRDRRTVREDVARLSRWLAELAEQNEQPEPNYEALIEQVRQELFDYRYAVDLDPKTRQLVPREVQNLPFKAFIALLVAQMFQTGDCIWIRRCAECGAVFASPTGFGRPGRFCTPGHANRHKTRAYRHRKKAKAKADAATPPRSRRAPTARKPKEQRP